MCFVVGLIIMLIFRLKGVSNMYTQNVLPNTKHNMIAIITPAFLYWLNIKAIQTITIKIATSKKRVLKIIPHLLIKYGCRKTSNINQIVINISITSRPTIINFKKPYGFFEHSCTFCKYARDFWGRACFCTFQ